MREEAKGRVTVLVAVVLLMILSLPAVAQSLSRREVTSTPYDSYLGSFRTVASKGAGLGSLTGAVVHNLTERANDFRYEHIEAYRPQSPEQLEASGRGDCKDKALWLYAKLRAAGARNVQMVIGKKDTRSEEFHAWIYLTLDGRTYLLDPTFSSSVVEASEFGAEEYIAVYGYDGAGTYVYDTAAAGISFDPRYQTPMPVSLGR
jgi:transglutaminase superfamily protein